MTKHMQAVNRFYHSLRSGSSSKVRLLLLYRNTSLLLTSVFYLLGTQSPLYFKMGVIVSLGVAAMIITDLQKRYLDHSPLLKSIVLTETIGLTLLLIPTGGISSPFIWYALNPVLVAATFLSSLFCWTALTFYLGSATLIAYHFFHIDDMLVILEEKSYFYLVCLLMTLLAKLFSGLTKELALKASLLQAQQNELLHINHILTETNEKHQQTLEHIMSLYHLIENFAAQKEPKKLANEITSALLKCTQSHEAFFWLTNLNHQNSHIANATKNAEIETDLKKEWNNIRGKRELFVRRIKSELFLMKIIRTSGNVGVLGVKVSSSSEAVQTFLLNRPFEFLAELSEIMLERIHMDRIMEQMLVIEEQNRIANEIHDSVSQRLFGMVYALHSLQVKSKNMTWEELNQEYQFLSQSANTTMKELRKAIFRLSSVKKGEKPFLVQLEKYLDELSKLNEVQVDYLITGDEAIITDNLKQALYRIICEACGNAIRHGKCNLITIRLLIAIKKTVLTIQDDGIGIQLNLVEGGKEKGLGLLNVKGIVNSFAGTFSIKGKPRFGTTIQIDIPNLQHLNREEVVG